MPWLFLDFWDLRFDSESEALVVVRKRFWVQAHVGDAYVVWKKWPGSVDLDIVG